LIFGAFHLRKSTGKKLFRQIKKWALSIFYFLLAQKTSSKGGQENKKKAARMTFFLRPAGADMLSVPL